MHLKLFGKADYRVLGGPRCDACKQGRLDEAEPLLRKSVTIAREALGDDHLDPIWGLFNLERLLRKQGKLLDAKTTLRDAIKLFEIMRWPGRHAQNEIAWLLATYPDPEVRDGRSAVRTRRKPSPQPAARRVLSRHARRRVRGSPATSRKLSTFRRANRPFARRERNPGLLIPLKLYESNTRTASANRTTEDHAREIVTLR